MSQVNQHNRFRYGLRTLFAVVTVAGVLCGLGWNLRRVSQREQLLESLSDRGALLGRVVSTTSEKRMPILWTLLGAIPVGVIELPSDFLEDDELAWVATVFPEATIRSHSPRIDNPGIRASDRKILQEIDRR